MVRAPEILESSVFELPVSKVCTSGHLFQAFLYSTPLKDNSCIDACKAFDI